MTPKGPVADTPQTVLASFCNQPPGEPGLGVLRVTESGLELIGSGLPYSRSGIQQMTGLTMYDGVVFAAAKVNTNPCILELAPDLTIAATYTLPRVIAPHSLVAAGPDEFYVVSTGTDEVIRVVIDRDSGRIASEETVWQPTRHSIREDLHHVNGLTVANGRLIASGFGLGWRETREQLLRGETTAYDGFLVDILTGELLTTGLQMPHSPVALPGGIAWCESATHAMVAPGAGVATNLPGFTRGLCVVGDRILVGVSGRRRTDPEKEPRVCAVVALGSNDLSTRDVITLGPRTRGVYDLLPLGPCGARMSGFEQSSHATAR